MKKNLIVAVALLVSVTLCQAQSFKAGVHGGYTVGGDVEDKGFAYGLQGEMELNDLLSVELSGTGFSDSDAGADLDVKSIGLTGKCGMKLADKVRVYGGAGVDYNMFDGDVNATDLYIDYFEGTAGITFDEFAAAYGMTTAAARSQLAAEMEMIGATASFDVDNKIGFHVCAGVEVALTETIELFGEYRYTFCKVKGDISLNVPGIVNMEESFSDNYNFGIAKVGVNFLF